MSDDQQVQQTDDGRPAAIPWYQSKIIRGIVAGVVAQIIKRVQETYHIDLSVLGISANDLVAGAMDFIALAAVAFTARARLTQTSAPVITASKKKADVININSAPAPTQSMTDTAIVRTLSDSSPQPPTDKGSAG
jgi:hypothetical protein